MLPKVFFELHSGLPRQGPGSRASTERAFRMIPTLPDQPRILDMGCGPGSSAIELARLSGGRIIAVDNHEPFLGELKERADANGSSDNIEIMNGDMLNLDFSDETFDLIWSEGAIYIIGFSDGLRSWRKLIKSGGYLAVTEVCWLENDRPDELVSYWQENYPAIKSISENIEIINSCGYSLVSHFTLPDFDWWDEYYYPIEKRLENFSKKYADDAEALGVFEMETQEIEMFRKFSRYYGYVFYIMLKND
jgi:ubiquinone/menaquinone biosynthesis C-methylase UbiE